MIQIKCNRVKKIFFYVIDLKKKISKGSICFAHKI